MNTTIKFAKIRPSAIIPSKTEGNAGYDIYGQFAEEAFIVESLETKLIPTGIASVCDDGYYFQIQERGSTGSKGIKYGAGVIDSSYRGEWFVAITNCNSKPLVFVKDGTTAKYLEMDYIVYQQNKAIAQAVLLPVPYVEVKEYAYDELMCINSDRGTGTLGSSGK